MYQAAHEETPVDILYHLLAENTPQAITDVLPDECFQAAGDTVNQLVSPHGVSFLS